MVLELRPPRRPQAIGPEVDSEAPGTNDGGPYIP